MIRDTLLRPLIEQNERLQSRLEERVETIGKMQAAQEQIEAERDALQHRVDALQAHQRSAHETTALRAIERDVRHRQPQRGARRSASGAGGGCDCSGLTTDVRTRVRLVIIHYDASEADSEGYAQIDYVRSPLYNWPPEIKLL